MLGILNELAVVGMSSSASSEPGLWQCEQLENESNIT
jgi:hypothetical protein